MKEHPVPIKKSPQNILNGVSCQIYQLSPYQVDPQLEPLSKTTQSKKCSLDLQSKRPSISSASLAQLHKYNQKDTFSRSLHNNHSPRQSPKIASPTTRKTNPIQKNCEQNGRRGQNGHDANSYNFLGNDSKRLKGNSAEKYPIPVETITQPRFNESMGLGQQTDRSLSSSLFPLQLSMIQNQGQCEADCTSARQHLKEFSMYFSGCKKKKNNCTEAGGIKENNLNLSETQVLHTNNNNNNNSNSNSFKINKDIKYSNQQNIQMSSYMNADAEEENEISMKMKQIEKEQQELQKKQNILEECKNHLRNKLESQKNAIHTREIQEKDLVKSPKDETNKPNEVKTIFALPGQDYARIVKSGEESLPSYRLLISKSAHSAKPTKEGENTARRANKVLFSDLLKQKMNKNTNVDKEVYKPCLPNILFFQQAKTSPDSKSIPIALQQSQQQKQQIGEKKAELSPNYDLLHARQEFMKRCQNQNKSNTFYESNVPLTCRPTFDAPIADKLTQITQNCQLPQQSKQIQSKCSKQAYQQQSSKEARPKFSKDAQSKFCKDAQSQFSKETQSKQCKGTQPKSSKETQSKQCKDIQPKSSKETQSKQCKDTQHKSSKEMQQSNFSKERQLKYCKENQQPKCSRERQLECSKENQQPKYSKDTFVKGFMTPRKQSNSKEKLQVNKQTPLQSLQKPMYDSQKVIHPNKILSTQPLILPTQVKDQGQELSQNLEDISSKIYVVPTLDEKEKVQCAQVYKNPISMEPHLHKTKTLFHKPSQKEALADNLNKTEMIINGQIGLERSENMQYNPLIYLQSTDNDFDLISPSSIDSIPQMQQGQQGYNINEKVNLQLSETLDGSMTFGKGHWKEEVGKQIDKRQLKYSAWLGNVRVRNEKDNKMERCVGVQNSYSNYTIKGFPIESSQGCNGDAIHHKEQQLQVIDDERRRKKELQDPECDPEDALKWYQNAKFQEWQQKFEYTMTDDSFQNQRMSTFSSNLPHLLSNQNVLEEQDMMREQSFQQMDRVTSSNHIHNSIFNSNFTPNTNGVPNFAQNKQKISSPQSQMKILTMRKYPQGSAIRSEEQSNEDTSSVRQRSTRDMIRFDQYENHQPEMKESSQNDKQEQLVTIIEQERDDIERRGSFGFLSHHMLQRNHQWLINKEQKISQQQRVKMQKELDSCTFKPSLISSQQTCKPSSLQNTYKGNTPQKQGYSHQEKLYQDIHQRPHLPVELIQNKLNLNSNNSKAVLSFDTDPYMQQQPSKTQAASFQMAKRGSPQKLI